MQIGKQGESEQIGVTKFLATPNFSETATSTNLSAHKIWVANPHPAGKDQTWGNWGFRKRGRRNGVASDFFPVFFSVFFRFLPFSSVFSLFSFRFLQFSSVFFRFLPVSSVSFRFFPFFSVSFSEKTGRHRSRDPFCETPRNWGA